MMEEKKENLKEFKSDDVTLTIEYKAECIVEYKVKASPVIAKKARIEALRSISKEVSLPGFRKGRAPEYLIVKKFPKPLEERWKKSIADIAFQACQSLAQVSVLSNDSQISFNIEKQSIEEGAIITYTFEIEPKVPDIDIGKIELEEVKREKIDTKKIETTINDIQMYFANWEKVSGRGVKNGDYVLIDVDIIETDSPQKALANARFEVTQKKMANWMYELVIGMKIGDSKEGVSSPDPDASKKEKEATPPKKVRLILRSIEIPTLPEVNDTLAQKLGVKTAKEMTENLEKLLNKQADEHRQRTYKEQLSKILLTQYPFELPKSLIEKETQFRVKQLISDPNFQKKMVGMTEEDRKAAFNEIQVKGEQAIRLFYISKQIIQDHNIHISPNEVHKGVQTPLEAMFNNQEDLYSAQEESQEQKAIALSRLTLSKAEDYIISKAKIIPRKAKKSAGDKKTVGTKNTQKKVTQKKKETTTTKKTTKKSEKKVSTKKKS